MEGGRGRGERVNKETTCINCASTVVKSLLREILNHAGRTSKEGIVPL